jgi:5-formyltetrahydrofolate cyclo-ligase
MNKKDLRQQGRAIASTTQRDFAVDYDAAITELFFKTQYFMPRTVISAYMSLRGEVNCGAILHRLSKQGHITCLPVIVSRDQPMIFREYLPGDPTQTGSLGQLEPLDSAADIIPDILIVPMIGFSRQGFRLGYGSGFFDRTLQELRRNKSIKAIGIAYSTQEMPELVAESHDQKMDIIITEKEVISIK